MLCSRKLHISWTFCFQKSITKPTRRKNVVTVLGQLVALFKNWSLPDNYWIFFFWKTQTLWSLFMDRVLPLLKAADPLQEYSLLLTTRSPGFPVSHFIDLWRTKDWVDLGAIQRFRPKDSWTGIPAPLLRRCCLES